MSAVLEFFCLNFAFGILAGMLLVKRTDLLTPFFRNTALVALGSYSLYGYLSWRGDLAAYWPGGVLIVYAIGVKWFSEVLNKLFLLSLSIVLGFAFYKLFNSININNYNVYLEFGSALFSGLIMGLSLVAMNIGHSYLSTMKLPIRPLKTLVGTLMALIFIRTLVAIFSAWLLRSSISTYFSSLGIEGISIITITFARFLFGCVGAAILSVMVWKTVKIESTQSATGILYALLSMTLVGEICALFLNLHSPIWF